MNPGRESRGKLLHPVWKRATVMNEAAAGQGQIAAGVGYTSRTEL